MTQKTKVLFIAGTGRCGSTLLNSILAQVDDAFSTGELRYIWDRGVLENSYCGCGQQFDQCDIWPDILHASYGANLPDFEHMTYLRESFHTRSLFAAKVPMFKRFVRRKMQDYLMNLSKLYQGITKVTDSSLIIDSSKFPTHGYLLSLLPDVELYVLHLVRDPRAVAYSWQRRKQYGIDSSGDPVFMPQYGFLKSSYWWITWNSIIESLWKRDKYMRVRYEDFVDTPDLLIQSILRWVDHSSIDVGNLIDNKTVILQPNHAVSGNPSRFKSGSISLNSDNEWKTKLSKLPAWTTTLLSGLKLKRYKYNFFL